MVNSNFTEFPERKPGSVPSRQAKKSANPTAPEKVRKFPGVTGTQSDRSLGVKQVKIHPQKEGL